MALLSPSQMAQVNAIAEKSKQVAEPSKRVTGRASSVNAELAKSSAAVSEYFKDSSAILIRTVESLHEYIDNMILAGIGGLDTETTGLDRQKDTIVGVSLYYPKGYECYIPIKHIMPVFNKPYSDQLTYEQVGVELQRLVDSNVKIIFANADFDLSMVYKDLKVDLVPVCHYDVILAWRCIRENEVHNDLKSLYNKYVLKGAGDPKKFSDFFSPSLFPMCKPEIAALYAANDAKITYELYRWQLPLVIPSHKRCQRNHLEHIASLLWEVEIPMIGACQRLHRRGIYIEQSFADHLKRKYHDLMVQAVAEIQDMVQEILDDPRYFTKKRSPFSTGREFNPNSTVHVNYLIYDRMGLNGGRVAGTGKDVLAQYETPIVKKIAECRSLSTVIGTFVDKMPSAVWKDGKIHCNFRQVGADTGRMSSESPNLQNIPSKLKDIRRMFRADPGKVLLSSDYSSQEAKILAYVANDQYMIQAFKDGKDIHATVASIAFNRPYETCRETFPDGSANPEGAQKRNEAKTILFGIMYGRSVMTIGEQLYGQNPNMTPDQRLEEAQKVYNSIMKGLPGLKSAMEHAQNSAKTRGYVETILGRRRHIPEMQLPMYEVTALPGYVNPDIDPMDIDTLSIEEEIPKRIVDGILSDLAKCKYRGQAYKKIKEYREQGIKVVNNYLRIEEGRRQCLNSVIQGSAADMTKLAILLVEADDVWKELGGELLLPVHDELIAQCPIENAQAAGERLSYLMSKAADFLPMGIKCDVETSFRWYGRTAPCPYSVLPGASFREVHGDKLYEHGAQWVQFHLLEVGYPLPYNKKLSGDAAFGITGELTDLEWGFIDDYIKQYGIAPEDFIEHIRKKVEEGV